jgi:hypothetical protein
MPPPPADRETASKTRTSVLVSKTVRSDFPISRFIFWIFSEGPACCVRFHRADVVILHSQRGVFLPNVHNLGAAEVVRDPRHSASDTEDSPERSRIIRQSSHSLMVSGAPWDGTE